MNDSYPIFSEEMKTTHTILIPMMLSPHFTLVCEVLKEEGYHTEILNTTGPSIAETGVKYVHNDMCYPALLVIGQFIEALQSGRYDLTKTALLISQTGGGCRASNYIYILRKALKQSGFDNIPVVSVNYRSIDSNTLTLPPSAWLKLLYAILYGDFMLCLYNQTRSHELTAGSSKTVLDSMTSYVGVQLLDNHELLFEKHIKHILEEFKKIPRHNEHRPRVGIAGEIYLKYSPLGNNNLEQFLLQQGSEPVVSGFLDFLLYSMNSIIIDQKLYNIKDKHALAIKTAIHVLTDKQKQMIKIIEDNSDFLPLHSFDKLLTYTDKIISTGVKMGEGWLLSAEIAAYIEQGVENVACVQPFGCLPNHIASKGVMNNLKAKYPHSNIVTVDYDPGACKINQENRLGLMLMNAKKNAAKNGVTYESL